MHGARRFECAELPGNWVELCEAWTRRELREALNEQGEAFAALLQRKVAACHLETGGGGAITEPQMLTAEGLDEALRYEVYCWLTTTLVQFVLEVQRLGEATRRRLWRELANGEAAAAETETPTATRSDPSPADGELSPSPMR